MEAHHVLIRLIYVLEFRRMLQLGYNKKWQMRSKGTGRPGKVVV